MDALLISRRCTRKEVTWDQREEEEMVTHVSIKLLQSPYKVLLRPIIIYHVFIFFFLYRKETSLLIVMNMGAG